jgi:hypothetical protein
MVPRLEVELPGGRVVLLDAEIIPEEWLTRHCPGCPESVEILRVLDPDTREPVDLDADESEAAQVAAEAEVRRLLRDGTIY